jgi:hypothetical protein
MYFFSLEFSCWHLLCLLSKVPQSVSEQVLLALALLAVMLLALAVLALLLLALAVLALLLLALALLAVLALLLLALAVLALLLLALALFALLALLLQLELYQVLGISFLCAQQHYTHYSAQLYHAYLF